MRTWAWSALGRRRKAETVRPQLSRCRCHAGGLGQLLSAPLSHCCVAASGTRVPAAPGPDCGGERVSSPHIHELPRAGGTGLPASLSWPPDAMSPLQTAFRAGCSLRRRAARQLTAPAAGDPNDICGPMTAPPRHMMQAAPDQSGREDEQPPAPGVCPAGPEARPGPPRKGQRWLRRARWRAGV